MDDDRRTIKRTRVLRSAKIIVPRRSPVIHCTVQNVNNGGACLKLANTYGLPETFDLTFEHGRTRRSCRVIWRTDDKLGVAFTDSEAKAPEAEPQFATAGVAATKRAR
jgi:PilZ domain